METDTCTCLCFGVLQVLHSTTYISLLSSLGLSGIENPHLLQLTNSTPWSHLKTVSVESLLDCHIPQRDLSLRLDDHAFKLLMEAATVQSKPGFSLHTCRSAPHAAQLYRQKSLDFI